MTDHRWSYNKSNQYPMSLPGKIHANLFQKLCDKGPFSWRLHDQLAAITWTMKWQAVMQVGLPVRGVEGNKGKDHFVYLLHCNVASHWDLPHKLILFQTSFKRLSIYIQCQRPSVQGHLPERTRGRPWGRLRVRIRSIEKTSSWKFYPAAQNFTNRMLFRNTYIFKTI